MSRLRGMIFKSKANNFTVAQFQKFIETKMPTKHKHFNFIDIFVSLEVYLFFFLNYYYDFFERKKTIVKSF